MRSRACCSSSTTAASRISCARVRAAASRWAVSGLVEIRVPPPQRQTRASRKIRAAAASTPSASSLSLSSRPVSRMSSSSSGAATAAATAGANSSTLRKVPSSSPSIACPTRPPKTAAARRSSSSGLSGKRRDRALTASPSSTPPRVTVITRDWMVGSSCARFSQVRRKITCRGGSSRIFSRAFCACSVIFCASERISTR